jgi:hypothetical protein
MNAAIFPGGSEFLLYRYVNANIETTRRAAAALDAFNQGAVEQLVAAEKVETSDRFWTRRKR